MNEKIGKKRIGEGEACSIIAEAGSNHNGDIGIAKEMIRIAAKVGADYIKFQSWQSKNLKKDYTGIEYYRLRELSDEDHFDLIEECKKYNIKFLTSCFDIGRINFLKKLGLDEIKIPSPDIGSYRMIKMLRDNFKHLIISTGMAYEEEVRKTAEILKEHNFTFLHCVSLYPTPLEKVNMARMDLLRQFTPSVGFSDHTLGTEAAKLAIARGASFVEKHFTLDRRMPGKDQSISAEPHEIKEIVDYAKNVSTLMGDGSPNLCDEELEVRKIYVGKWGDNR